MELTAIYYNGYFTQLVYPENLNKQLEDYGLPAEDIKTARYDTSKIIPPFSTGPNLELFLLKEEIPYDAQVKDFNTVFLEIINTPEGKAFVDAIKLNNETLTINNLSVIPLETTPEDIATPTVAYYSVTETVLPSEVI